MNKKVSYSVNNQLILNERVNDLITTSSRKKTASPYTPSLSPLALRKNSFVTINDILDKIEIYYNNFSLLSDNKNESPITTATNIGIKKKNDNTNNELIDKLYKAKIKIMEESKDILIKRINELYEEQLVKLKEEYTTDYTKKEKLRECQLCFDSMECKVIIPCGHKLCEDCAKRLTTVSNKCPWDRQEIESIEFIKNETELG
ncbi:hypothetical protein LY90DRAFT_216121 [Neocallimastix californiae]|uniref:RING-type domain-containing protein n=1 Tax=Neocallimastix californiae TaxID=1754190 RepID=A0A1Y2E8H9_9FUNG|nr:hypothetical protein LY90DRAFT_216121 [Neocallimastix californiae]|eukprot:ORY67842.1 hypothetical protein LY90DRAFT_216121 [Neocallimastix californiae]